MGPLQLWLTLGLRVMEKERIPGIPLKSTHEISDDKASYLCMSAVSGLCIRYYSI